MLKIIFKKLKKYIILMHFRVKNILKNNRNHTLKHPNIPLNKNSFSFSTHISLDDWF